MEVIAHVHVAQQSRYWNAGGSETVDRVVPGMHDPEAQQSVSRTMAGGWHAVLPSTSSGSLDMDRVEDLCVSVCEVVVPRTLLASRAGCQPLASDPTSWQR